MRTRLTPLLPLLLAIASAGAQAANIVGGSSLLTNQYANQLESWLGEGNITLTNIYTKQTGHTASNFHAAVDGKGRTISVMYATENNGHGTSAIIGGYNNVSWNSINNYVYDTNLGDGDNAFVFNLSTGVKKDLIRSYATYDNVSYGPTFGGGHDIYVNFKLSGGYSYGHSFGSGSTLSLIDGSMYNGGDVVYGAIEVFTIAAAPVPEPAALLMACVGLAVVGAARSSASRKR